ncbi:MAG TPA: hypothetical protein VGJ45_17685 [Pseudonocardiaceae bacterium]|jgi:hypothetical protein
MDTTVIPLDGLSHWDDGEPPDIDELRVPLGTWTDPAGDGVTERHIVRSID